MEIRLGLAIIILVLVILNFASHYTLFRIRNSVQNSIVEELTEAAIIASNDMSSMKNPILPDSVLSELRYRYTLSKLVIEPLDYSRSLTIQKNLSVPFSLLELDNSLSTKDLYPLFENEAVLRHRQGSRKNLLLFPTEYYGSKYIIAIEKESSLLSSIEQAGSILFIAGIAGILIILYAAYKFARYVIYPYKRLKEEAEKSGRFVDSGTNDEISDLIHTYESIIDDLRRNENELKKQMAIIVEMSGGLAHQLRNSIGGIVGFARLIGKRNRDDDLTRSNVDSLLGESKEAELLVNRFLDFARPLNLESESVDLIQLLVDIIDTCSHKYPNVYFDLNRKEEFLIEADPLMLKQALVNIINNACTAFCGAGGEVIFNISRRTNKVDLQVRDNGPGIPEDFHDKIFAPFFSGAPSGTGLGLPLARKIINGHGGSVDFSTEEGVGTVFTISLPVCIPSPESILESKTDSHV